MLNVASYFSGAGGLDLGLERAGMRVVSQCEADPWRRRLLAARFSGVPCSDDVRQPAGGAAVDLVCGGVPCQDWSVAGNRAGLATGRRAGLFFDSADRIAEFPVRPTWLLFENVPGLLSAHGGRDFGTVLQTLADLGYGLCWRILDARYFGVPQQRRRVFIVGHSGGDPAPAALALSQGGERDLAAGRCSWQAASAGTGGGAALARRLTRPGRDDDRENLVVNALDRRRGGADDNEAQAGHLVVSAPTGGVRRLSPVECERLMSWPDDWTRLDADTPWGKRYAGCGDGVVANVGEWIGRRILAAQLSLDGAAA